MGHFRFIIFYLLSGIIAVLAFSFVNTRQIIPMVSASGVDWFAHIGGFVAGMILIGLFKKRNRIVWE